MRKAARANERLLQFSAEKCNSFNSIVRLSATFGQAEVCHGEVQGLRFSCGMFE